MRNQNTRYSETVRYLSRLYRYSRMIENKRFEVFQLNAMATSISACQTGERVQSSGSQDRMGDAVAELIDLKNEIAQSIQNYVEEYNAIILELEKIENPTYQEVLHRRYVRNQTFDEIAREMSYSWRQIIRIHQYAVEDFYKTNRNVIECHIHNKLK